jgi:hypothetical protein
MHIQSGNKFIQMIGCLFAAITVYYAVFHKNIILGIIGVSMFVYDGFLVMYVYSMFL